MKTKKNRWIIWVACLAVIAIGLVVFLPRPRHIVLRYDDGEVKASLDAKIYVCWWKKEDNMLTRQKEDVMLVHKNAKGTFELEQAGEKITWTNLSMNFVNPYQDGSYSVLVDAAGYCAKHNCMEAGMIQLDREYNFVEITKYGEEGEIISCTPGCTTKE